jgi:hypothetical protein
LCSVSSSRIKGIVSCQKNKVKIKTAPYIPTPKGGGFTAHPIKVSTQTSEVFITLWEWLISWAWQKI